MHAVRIPTTATPFGGHGGSTRFIVSELADYELRRELLRLGAATSLSRLDELSRELPYAPITRATWRHAAALWALTRSTGKLTAPPEALDGDVLVAAQALAATDGVGGRSTLVVKALGTRGRPSPSRSIAPPFGVTAGTLR
jgi:hypothetical protein